MINNRFNQSNGFNFNSSVPDTEEVLRTIVKLLQADTISDTTFGSMFEKMGSNSSNPSCNIEQIKTEEFTRQLKLAIDDCFEGDIISDGLGSLFYMLTDKTIFKIQITKL